MINYRYSILSIKERDRIMNSFFSEKNITADFSLNIYEIHRIKRFNKPYISLGYALQYLFLKARGISVLNSYELIPKNITDYVADQINCSSKHLNKYWAITNTKSRNFQEITKDLNYSRFQNNDDIDSLIYKITLKTGNKFCMVEKFINELKYKKIIIPSFSTIEEIISKGILSTEDLIYKKLCSQIQDKDKLDDLFIIESSGESRFSRIKNTSVNISSNGVKQLLNLIKEINEYGDIVDLSFLSEDKIRYLSTQIQRSNKIRIERFKDTDKKYSYLSMFLYFKRKEFMDMTIEIISSHIHSISKRSKNKAQKHNFKNQAKYKSNSEKLKVVVENILEIDSLNDFNKYKNSISQLKIELDAQEDDLEEIDFLLKSYQSINYINDLLDVIEFDSNTKPELIKFLKQFRSQKIQKKDQVDISLFDSKWQKNIEKYKYSKKVLGMTLMYTIRDGIRSGDLFVRESKKYNSFDHYLITPTENLDDKQALGFIENLKNSIHIPNQFEINRDIEQDEKSTFSKKIYNYFPKTTMAEILYEVNRWTDFLEDFRSFHRNKVENQKVLVASLLSDGHNLGFAKMSIASSIDEHTLIRSSELYLNYDNISRAQKNLVNYHNSLKIVKNWGSGQNSSSDGMRVPISSKTIYADYNSHYGNKGGGIYRHVSDQYTPYYVQMLEGRDSNHVLDGLLYHGTSLDIYDHSTDTAGYTEQMFALTYLLGFNFKPRIKNIQQQQLYAFESFEANEIKFRKINEKIILENYAEVMRLVESIRCSKVKASLILQKINSYNRNNGVAKGLKEIGRILKTKYIIDYYTDGKLRKEVQKMLNKGESINSVARLIFFGKHGRLNENTLEKQLEKVSCLNILLSSLIIWNSRYLEKVYNEVKDKPWFDIDEFKRVSPLGTQHVNFLGRYIFENIEISTEDGLRALEIKA